MKTLILLFNPARNPNADPSSLYLLFLSQPCKYDGFSYCSQIMSLGYILFRRREEGPTFTKITLEIKPPIMVPLYLM